MLQTVATVVPQVAVHLAVEAAVAAPENGLMTTVGLLQAAAVEMVIKAFMPSGILHLTEFDMATAAAVVIILAAGAHLMLLMALAVQAQAVRLDRQQPGLSASSA